MAQCSICGKNHDDAMTILHVYSGEVVNSKSEAGYKGKTTIIQTTTTYRNVRASDLMVCKYCSIVRRWVTFWFVTGAICIILLLFAVGYMNFVIAPTFSLMFFLYSLLVPAVFAALWWRVFKEKKNLEAWAVNKMNEKNTGKTYLTRTQHSRLR